MRTILLCWKPRAWRRLLPGLVWLSCFLGVFDRDLWTPDEPRDASVAFAMSHNGDWIVPRLGGEPFMEKPSLFFALGGLMAKFLGAAVGPVAAIRLVSVVCGIGVMVFTFLIGRRLLSPRVGFVAAMLLGTMPAFSKDLHWVRVDMTLTFFVLASIYCFIRLFEDRWWWCGLLGGVSAGAAFLVKGVIGPLLIGMAWFALVLHQSAKVLIENKPFGWHVIGHLSALTGFFGCVGGWVWRLLARGDSTLWNAWFWDNHVGRANGTSRELGHMHAGEPWYYVVTLILCALPWTPVLVCTLWGWGQKWRTLRCRRPAWAWWADARFFLLAWGVLGLVFLTIPVTKRNVYFIPLLPAWALICASGWFRVVKMGWIKKVYCGMMWVGAFALLVMTLSPAWTFVAARFIPLSVAGTVFSMYHVATAVLLALLWVIIRHRGNTPLDWLLTAAILLNGFWLVPTQLIDGIKQMGPGYSAFAARLPQDEAEFSRIAGYNLTETGRGGLEFYGNVLLPRIMDESRAVAILAGQDAEFDQLVVERGPGPDEWNVPVRVLAEHSIVAKNRKRTLYWITGQGEAGREKE